MRLDSLKRLLTSPLPWALLAGAGLIVALVIDPTAPAWIFGSAIALSCAGAFTATWFAR